jgi:hypothetical protein
MPKTPTSGNPPSGSEEGPNHICETCRRSSGNATDAGFDHRRTIAGSRVCCDHRQNPPNVHRDASETHFGRPSPYAHGS